MRIRLGPQPSPGFSRSSPLRLKAVLQTIRRRLHRPLVFREYSLKVGVPAQPQKEGPAEAGLQLQLQLTATGPADAGISTERIAKLTMDPDNAMYFWRR